MTIDLAAETTDDFKFNITGGGAQFQLGPDVVTNQQLRVGIQSLNTARLGGVNGKMYQLQTGGNADLSSDPNQAAKIVGDAINVVTDLRGRLGALQGLTMDTNIKTMEDTMENMVQAESQIRDADFAVETANLTRAQVLVQSGTTVLSIANQNPRNVLALLQG
jgi:flagellin